MRILSEPLHHAYGIAGNADALVPNILSALKKSSVGFSATGNPDFRLERYETMGIDEARVLKEGVERTAVTGGKKVFIVSAHGITKEAQNALLKIIEEPPPGTHFFFIVPSVGILLPTLRSRLFILSVWPAEAGKASSRVVDFLASAVPARLKTVQALLKQAEESEGKRDFVSFLDELEHALAKDTEANVKPLSELLEVKKYSRDRAPSFKLLLEHLALVLPKVE